MIIFYKVRRVNHFRSINGRHNFSSLILMPDDNLFFESNSNTASESEVIKLAEEFVVIHKEVIETGKVHIRKSVTEEMVAVNLPVVNESYDINHIPGDGKILDHPPGIRHEGNITIIPVIKEVTVVQKKYVVIEELQLVKKITQTPLTQEITLRKEHVDIQRTRSNK
jgi:uncharacterized protein (TIGR02271 family)